MLEPVFPRRAAALLALLAVSAACGVSTKAPRRNVLLITLDTTRADHLGCYGRAGDPTPSLDALAAEGTRFDVALDAGWKLVHRSAAPERSELFDLVADPRGTDVGLGLSRARGRPAHGARDLRPMRRPAAAGDPALRKCRVSGAFLSRRAAPGPLRVERGTRRPRARRQALPGRSGHPVRRLAIGDRAARRRSALQWGLPRGAGPRVERGVGPSRVRTPPS